MLWSPLGGAATILRFGQKIGRKSLYKKTYVQLQELKGMVDMGSLEMVEITGPYHRTCQYVSHICLRGSI